MLEESSMEKNFLNRVAQPPVKGSSSDSKKSQDGSKSFPRGSKRREIPGPSTSKVDQNRKPVPQKTKCLDKRPRSKGQFKHGRKEGTEVAGDDDGAEYGSVVKRESKKHNLNHLLNFHYAPRPGEQWGSYGNPVRTQRQFGYASTKNLMATHKHKYNKEQFLQANCQFVVRSDEDYSLYLGDPDILVDWELVEQIRMPTTSEMNCPICLFQPVAAKMTRCGHIFCWPCILHYLALSDKTWRKCPICYEAVHKGDLKSVTALPWSFYSVGEPITFKLMKREKGTMQSVPASQFDVYRFDKPLSVSEKQLDTMYTKLLVADSNEVLNVVETEEKQLLMQLKEEEGCPEICFVEQALESVRERKRALFKALGRSLETEVFTNYNNSSENSNGNNELDNSASSKTADNENKISGIECLSVVNDNVENEPHNVNNSEESSVDGRTRYESVSSEGGEEGSQSLLSTNFLPEDLEFNAAPASNNQPSNYFYFYQASDGQQVYLHAINTRMLEMSYGSLENCPDTITGRVLEKESGSMTEELRKRLKYLQHLPLTCQFEVVEIELKELVSEETMGCFQEQLETRDRRREKRAREERRREKRIEENEKKMYGQYWGPKRRIRLDSYQHFPECGSSETYFMPTLCSDESSRSNSPNLGSARSISPVTTEVASLSLDQTTPDQQSMSFAQMLRDGKSFPGTSMSLNAWPSVSKSNRLRKPVEFPELGTSPTSNQNYNEAMHLLVKSSMRNEPTDNDGNVSGGKKKKKKQQVLFSIGMNCASK